MIILETNCGLCNRLRAVEAALALAGKYGQELTVIWDNNDDCRCDYTDLFLPSPRFRILSTGQGHGGMVRKGLKLKAKLFGAYLDQAAMDAGDLRGEKLEQTYASLLADPKKLFYILTWDSFFETQGEAYSWLKPQPEIQEEIDGLANKLGPAPVGLHIRRTDHMEAIAASPSSLFAEAMEKELAENPDTRFYVATDEISEREQLVSQFGERIVFKPHQTISRNSLAGMKDSLLDFWCLSRCRRIFGSFHSSFSEEAARLGGCELIPLMKK